MTWRCTIIQGKPIGVADTLSRKSYVNVTIASQMPQDLYKEYERLNLGFVAHTDGITIEVEPTLEQEIQKGQLGDVKINEIKELIEAGKAPDFTKDEQAIVRFQKRICVPDVDHLREMILKEAMIQFTRFIQAIPRCTRIEGKGIGGIV